ncbi:MAG: primosomal protein N' [Williamsia sp.]|nr:primosomal protein N' [Williamsia sp.]
MFETEPAAYVEVVIPLALPKNYTWSVPPDLLAAVKPGCRVEVVLGKNKKYAGVVKRIHHDKPEAFEPKDILNVLDTEPIVFPEQQRLWEWMASYYSCSEGEVMQAALPTHLKLSSETVLLYNEEAGEDFSGLDEDEFLVAEALLIKNELKLAEVQQILDATHVYPVIKRLIEKKICFVWEELKSNYKEKKESYVLLSPEYHNEEKLAELINKKSKAPKQMELLLAFLHLMKTQGEVTQNDLLKKAGASLSQLKGLIQKDVVRVEKRSTDRIKYLPKIVQLDFTLSEAQQRAARQVDEVLSQKQVCLLHGVTASGKTLIYISLIAGLVKQGKQVLYMLPEIALTSQIIRRLQHFFGGHITVYHSKFNHSERLEIWNKVKSGEAKIIVGARSSLFLPFKDLGLIICDEEHDTSFKQQDPAPRYHARDAAIYYASLHHAKVLLGSATPSMETYFNAMSGKYGLVELLERFGQVELPKTEIIDTKKASSVRNKIIITPFLKDAIEGSLSQGKQVILFQNKRGYSPYQVCQACGWIPHCRYCDVSLTYHKLSNKLQCHYCGTVYPMISTCQACGNHHFVQHNFGTERIEESLQEQFPGVNIGRMDVDAVRGKNAHDTLIQSFEQKSIDILVGTQMVVKGLDFENVELVGILDADAILGFTDFRVNERAFQLMEQVSGRAGRKEKQGLVMIQVRNTAHPVLECVQQHDFKLFYKTEIDNRQRFFYPPYARLIKLTFKHKFNNIVVEAAEHYNSIVQPKWGKYLIGPAQPVVNRVRNQFLMELLFKLPKDSALISQAKQSIEESTAQLHQDKKFRSVAVIVDVDPL